MLYIIKSFMDGLRITLNLKTGGTIMRKMKQFVSLLLTSAMLLTSGASVNAFEPPSSAEEAIQSGFSSSENAYAI